MPERMGRVVVRAAGKGLGEGGGGGGEGRRGGGEGRGQFRICALLALASKVQFIYEYCAKS